MIRRFLPYFIVFFGILAFSKLMSLLNSNTSIIQTHDIHANNQEENVNSHPSSTQTKKPSEVVSIKDQNNHVIGEVYNLDTSKSQQISTCGKLYGLSFSPEEVNLLQTLRARHEKLQEIEKELQSKAGLLQSIQNEIDKQINKLEKLQSEINDDNGDSTSYTKLVKIYEGMKPKEAAKIFDELQTHVMLGVAKQMKENKLAAIVAEMEPARARDLTIALAQREN